VTIQRGLLDRARISASATLRSILRPLMVSRYSFIFPQAYRVYSPWFEKAFLRDVYEPLADLTLLTEDRCYLLDRLVRLCALMDGDMAELGVYKGGGALVIGRALREARASMGVPAPKLYLFDSFEGMPPTSGHDAKVHAQGDFGDTSVEAVAKVMAPFPFAILRKGYIPDSLKGLENEKFSFVHCDLDLYKSTIDSLHFFYGRLVPGGVMLFDDYGIRIYENAEKKAVDEFFADKPEKPISLANGQTVVVKAPAVFAR
jgi:O-methyltransferase